MPGNNLMHLTVLLSAGLFYFRAFNRKKIIVITRGEDPGAVSPAFTAEYLPREFASSIVQLSSQGLIGYPAELKINPLSA